MREGQTGKNISQCIQQLIANKLIDRQTEIQMRERQTKNRQRDIGTDIFKWIRQTDWVAFLSVHSTIDCRQTEMQTETQMREIQTNRRRDKGTNKQGH